MPYFVILQRFTPEGRKGMRQAPGRIKKNIENLSAAGVKSLNVFLTFGPHDIAALVEAPNDEAVLNMLGQLAEQGAAESIVLRAFTLDEAERAFSQ